MEGYDPGEIGLLPVKMGDESTDEYIRGEFPLQAAQVFLKERILSTHRPPLSPTSSSSRGLQSAGRSVRLEVSQLPRPEERI